MNVSALEKLRRFPRGGGGWREGGKKKKERKKERVKPLSHLLSFRLSGVNVLKASRDICWRIIFNYAVLYGVSSGSVVNRLDTGVQSDSERSRESRERRNLLLAFKLVQNFFLEIYSVRRNWRRRDVNFHGREENTRAEIGGWNRSRNRSSIVVSSGGRGESSRCR